MKIGEVNPKAGNVAKLTLLGLIGAGVAGNGYWTYQNQLNQTEQVAQLNGELGQSKNTIEGLNKLLLQEQFTNQTQATQMSDLSSKLHQGKLETQRLMSQVTRLNKDLDSRITLDQIMSIVQKVTPSTVRVQGEVEGFNFFTGQKEKFTVTGSGVIIIANNGQRYILTNGHVVQGSEIRTNEFKDGVYRVTLYNGSDYKKPIEFNAAPVMLSNGKRAYSAPEENDLALLQIPADVKLPPGLGIRMRDITTNPLKVGEPVVAVGNPFNERDSVSFGIMSHIDRQSNLNHNHHIQTDAAINPGNSGGGLFDMQGNLVGINTWGYRNTNGVGGSIRIDYIKKMLEGWGIPVMSEKERELLKATK